MSVRAGQYFNYGADGSIDISYGFYSTITSNGKLAEQSNKIEERDKTSSRNISGVDVTVTYDRDSYLVYGGCWGMTSPMYYDYRKVDSNSFKTKVLKIGNSTFDIANRDNWKWYESLAFRAFEYLLEPIISQMGVDQYNYTNNYNAQFAKDNHIENDYYNPVNGYKVRCEAIQ